MEGCKVCREKHNPERPHCPQCGLAMVQQQRDRIFGWGCGNQWHSGCYFWIPYDPRQNSDRKFCLECHDFVPHHFWIYDGESPCGKRRWGEWFCVECFGPLPVGRENVQKHTRALSSPARFVPQKSNNS